MRIKKTEKFFGLKFDDFDLSNNIIRIRRQLVNDPQVSKNIEVGNVKVSKYKLVEKPPKKDSYRNLKVPKIIIQELEKRKAEYEVCKNNNPNFIDSKYISFNKKTGKSRIPNSLNTYLNRKCNDIGISKISVHSLRHLFSTILMERGVPIIKISALLGHSSPNTTFEIYCGIMEEKDKILTFMNNTFSVNLVR